MFAFIVLHSTLASFQTPHEAEKIFKGGSAKQKLACSIRDEKNNRRHIRKPCWGNTSHHFHNTPEELEDEKCGPQSDSNHCQDLPGQLTILSVANIDPVEIEEESERSSRQGRSPVADLEVTNKAKLLPSHVVSLLLEIEVYFRGLGAIRVRPAHDSHCEMLLLRHHNPGSSRTAQTPI